MKKSAGSKPTTNSSNLLGHANKVTPLSKVMAATIFVALPFVGFWLGFNYQNELVEMYGVCMRATTEAGSMAK